jgi:hypothetical protein
MMPAEVQTRVAHVPHDTHPPFAELFGNLILPYALQIMAISGFWEALLEVFD